MKSKTILIALFLSFFVTAQTEIKVQSEPSDIQISKHIYGHFAEHLGRCIYGGFYVGEDSEIPNLDGVRTDIIAAQPSRTIKRSLIN